jgi:hypothetical protein
MTVSEEFVPKTWLCVRVSTLHQNPVVRHTVLRSAIKVSLVGSMSDQQAMAMPVGVVDVHRNSKCLGTTLYQQCLVVGMNCIFKSLDNDFPRASSDYHCEFAS